MVLRQGQLLHGEYMKQKYKNGLKICTLTEPSGLILKSLVYVGESNDYYTTGRIAKVALELMKDHLNIGHALYIDSSYNSFQLINQLTIHGTYCTGILHRKRKLNPQDVRKAKLKEGETIAQFSNNIMVVKWGSVLYISNEHKNDMIDYVDKKKCQRSIPAAIFNYDKYTFRPDWQEEVNCYHPCANVSLRWYTKVGYHFIFLMVLNSYLLHQKYSREKMSLHKFRLALLRKMLNREHTE